MIVPAPSPRLNYNSLNNPQTNVRWFVLDRDWNIVQEWDLIGINNNVQFAYK
jgi:hypothetical protein